MGSTDWIAVAQDRDRWRVLVNALMNLRVQLNTGISLLAEDLLASQK
jgi:hypothetical protein